MRLQKATNFKFRHDRALKCELQVEGRGMDELERDEERVEFKLFDLLFPQLLISCRLILSFVEE